MELEVHRGFNSKLLEDQLAVTLLGIRSEGPRDLLNKIKCDASYDKNLRVLLQADVGRVQDTLTALGGNPEGLTKEGVCLGIMLELQRRMPSRCLECKEMVCFDLANPDPNVCVACS